MKVTKLFKKVSAAVIAVAMVAGLAACGTSTTETTTSATTAAPTTEAATTAAPAEEAASLVLWGSEDDQTMLKEMAASFIELHPTYTIEVRVTGADKAKDAALQDLDAAADVFQIAHGCFPASEAYGDYGCHSSGNVGLE